MTTFINTLINLSLKWWHKLFTGQTGRKSDTFYETKLDKQKMSIPITGSSPMKIKSNAEGV